MDRNKIANINSLSVGDGNEPEAALEALMRAIDSRAVGGWRNNVNKQVIVMGDAPPHDPSREGLTAASVARAAEEADPVIIQAIVVGNEGVYSSEAAATICSLARGNNRRFAWGGPPTTTPYSETPRSRGITRPLPSQGPNGRLSTRAAPTAPRSTASGSTGRANCAMETSLL